MIEVGWFLGTVAGFGVLVYTITVLLLREIRALTRALIANNSKDLAMLDKSAAVLKSAPKRRPADVEGDFDDRKPKVMGL